MKTIFDLICLLVFGGLAVLFLQRSVETDERGDRIWHYAPPAVGCAIANFVGNRGLDTASIGLEVVASLILLASVGYIVHMLQPLKRK